jgi:hypothetical protein
MTAPLEMLSEKASRNGPTGLLIILGLMKIYLGAQTNKKVPIAR